jgi:hypothetical protein
VVRDHTSELQSLRSAIEGERSSLLQEASNPSVGKFVVTMLLLLAVLSAVGAALALLYFVVSPPRGMLPTLALVLGMAWTAGCAYVIPRDLHRFKRRTRP